MSRVKLEDVAIESRETYKGDKTGFPIVGLEHITPENVTLSNWDMDTENTFTKMFHKGDMLFGRRRAYLKKAAQAPFDGICSGDITVIRAKADKILPELLPFIIQNDALFDFAVGKSAGSLSPRVKWENLKNYSFELSSLDEQHKLAEVLWSINDTLKAYQKLLVETDELVKSQFIERFGDPISNNKQWPSEEIQKIAPANNVTVSTTGDVWILNLDMIESETGKIIEKVKVPVSEIGSSTGTFNETMVLYSKLRPYLNKVVLPDEPGYATNELVPMQPDETKLKREFLASLLRSDEFVTYAKHISGGTQMPRMPMNAIRKFECILPPIEMQNDFICLLRQSDKSKFELKNTIESLRAMRNNLVSDVLDNM